MPTFFSLTPKEAAEYRQGLFSQIHEIVFHGGGGYDWHTVYEMPIWLRNFTFDKIHKHFIEQNKASKGTSSNDINKAKDILKQAERADPANANKNKYMDKFSKKQPPSDRDRVNLIPDFVTTKATKA